jgi:hypothetical protein
VDAEPRRRRADESLGYRVTVLEGEMQSFIRRFDEQLRMQERTNERLEALARKLDDRADRQDVMFARLLGAVSVLVVVGQFAAPVVLRSLGFEP